MHRALALLAGLLLVSQVAAQPIAAIELQPGLGAGLHQTTPSKPDRPGPGSETAGDNKTVPPKPDMKAELVKGWWDGYKRHSVFRATNVGKGNAPSVLLLPDFYTAETDGTNSLPAKLDKIDVGAIAPGEFIEHEVVCKPAAGRVCSSRYLRVHSATDPVVDNNLAEDSAGQEAIKESLLKPDMKTELITAWWQGDDRHALYRSTNVGKGTADLVYVHAIYNVKFDGCCNQGDAYSVNLSPVENVKPGQALQYEIVCAPKTGWSCAGSVFWVDAFDDENDTNDAAKESL